MRYIVASLVTLLAGASLAGCVSHTTLPAAPASVASAASIAGTWKVDLRPTPKADPYYQELVIASVNGNAFSGTFYGAPISQARINTDWNAVRIAFVTSDGSGAYHHAAVLKDGRWEGMTNSTGRDFLAYWSAARP